MALLDVSGVTLRYKTSSAVVTATERVSFTVDRSDRFVLLGPSGCGKSTLLKEPGMMEWNLEPQGTMKFAAHLFKTGTLKNQPKAWTDYYLPVAHDLKGN